MNYLASEPEFFKFLTNFKRLDRKTKGNYISWLRFLSHYHLIDDTITKQRILTILEVENIAKNHRNIYSKEKDISNFKSALNNYLYFINEEYSSKIYIEIESKVSEINNRQDISATEKLNLTLSRIGQGRFRSELINYWYGCSISQFDKINLLVASHIKPWVESSDFERIDVYNGLLLLPNYDKLFDKGYISFDSKGKIYVSNSLNENSLHILNINPDLKLVRIDDRHKEYLEYHRENCFIS